MDFLTFIGTIAIIIFVTKEMVEFIKKRKVQRIKLEGIKSLLSIEIERNHSLLSLIDGNLSAAFKDYEKSDELYFTPYDVMELHKVADTVLNKELFNIAELDESFYSAVVNYSESLASLKTLRDSSQYYIFSEQRSRRQVIDYYYYTNKPIPKIKANFEHLYKMCTGQDEIDITYTGYKLFDFELGSRIQEPQPS